MTERNRSSFGWHLKQLRNTLGDVVDTLRDDQPKFTEQTTGSDWPAAVRAFITTPAHPDARTRSLVCSTLLIGTKRMLCRPTASQIASISHIVLVRLDVPA